MARSIVVIGAGLAGLAAAWSARRRGLQVTVVSAGPGASALAGGALDDVPWEQRERAAALLGLGGHAPVASLPLQVVELAAELGLWDLPAGRAAELAALAGRLRPARGRDRALLDLAPLRRTRVLVPRAERPGWDADALAAALTDEPSAQARGLRFLAVDAPILRRDDERRIADGDLAARHDDPARLEWLAEALRRAVAQAGGAGGVLLGPWLGARAPRAEALAGRVGVPVGEALAGAGSPAGLRFEAARDALLEAAGALRVHDRAVAVELGDPDAPPASAGRGPAPRVRVTLARDDERLAADAVLLAVGGVAGGGVVYLPAEHAAAADLPPRARVAFALSVAAPVSLGDGRGPLEIESSLHGPELDATAWPRGARPGALEAVGVRCDDGVRAAPGVYAAGDAVAGRPRTALEAVLSGLRAGAEV